MKSVQKSLDDFSTGDYEWYEERKGKIKRVSSEHRPRREIKNWEKAWRDHTEDFDERDEFYEKHSLKR